MNKRYIVRLTKKEREELKGLLSKGTTQAYRIRHAQILLKANAREAGWSDEKIAEAYGVHVRTVENVRRRYVEEGWEAALGRKPQERPSRERLLDGKGEAQMIALSCSQPPEGRSRWTLKLLADRLVALEVVQSISDQTVRRMLKKTNCSLT